MAKNAKTVLGTEAVQENASTYVSGQWWLHSNDAANAHIHVMDAWKITKGHTNVTIAFLDSQVENDYPNIGHGALCKELATGKFGVAPNCSALLVKIPLQSNDDTFVEIFETTARMADIICCSWAVTPIYRPLSPRLFNCISELSKHSGPQKNGCLFCFAAGNCNAPVKDLDNKEFLWLDESIDFIRVTNGPIENGFASHPDVLTVTACTSLNKKANYSNWGNEVDLCAPSNNFHPFSRSFRVEGQRTVDVPLEVGDEIITRSFGGTSAATALVAGVAGLVKSAKPQLSAAETKTILQQSADKIIDETNALNTVNWFGYGKVNAAKAVSSAIKFQNELIKENSFK